MSHPDADRGLPAAGLDKVTDRHRERLAVVYVRQSTAGQVQRHRESTQLQYGLVERAEALGWPRSRGRWSSTTTSAAPAPRPTAAPASSGSWARWRWTTSALILGVEM